MERPRKQYSNVGVPRETREKLRKIAKCQGRFLSEVVQELVDRKFASIQKSQQKF